MGKLIEAMKLVVALIPALIQVIKAFEDGVDTPGNGTAKKEALMSIIRVILAAIKDYVTLPIETITNIADKAIDILVTLFNKTGIFKKSNPVENA